MMHFKHLRGKHDQKDHGRRAIGDSRTRAATTGLSTLSENEVAEIRTKARNSAQATAEMVQKTRGSTTTDEKLRDARELMDISSQLMKNLQRNLRQSRRGVLLPRLPGDTPAKQQQFIEGMLLTAAFRIDHHREQYNNLVATIQAERRIERKLKKGQAKAGPFESLSNDGLLGWSRQRPSTPPDYTAFDQEVNPPAWISQIAQRYKQRFKKPKVPASLLPRGLRDITATPEGLPVRAILPRDDWVKLDGATRLSDLSSDQLYPGGAPVYREKDWGRGVFDIGEEVFQNQNSADNARLFWDQTPPIPTPWNNAPEEKLRSAVATYGNMGYKPINSYLRNNRDTEAFQNIEREAREILEDERRAKSEQVMTKDQRMWKRSSLRTRLREIEEIQRDIAALDAGMRPSPQTILTRRGVSLNVVRRMRQHLQVGDRFTDDAFTSVSIDPTFNWGEDSSMTTVILTKGTPTLWTDGHARGYEENEAIVGRGVTYEVISMDNERGIILRTIPPEDRYITTPVSTHGDNDPFSPEVRQFLSEQDVL